MDKDWEIITTGDYNFFYEHTFRNKKTGEVCSQIFGTVYDVSEDWAAVQTHHGWTYFNPNTKELCSQRFSRDIYDVSEGWAAVKTESGCTFFNPNTKELCSQRFERAYSVSEGWAAVKTESGYTFFNPDTKELCSQKFKDVAAVKEGWAAVKTESGCTFFNPNTKRLCSQRFRDIYKPVVEGLARVETKDGFCFSNPKLDMQFQSKFSNGDDMSIETCLREHPEDFALLPTVQFRDQKKIESYLDAAAEGVKAQCSEKGTTEEVEKFANEIKTLIANKIKAEKAKIASEDPQAKIKVAEKAAYKIKSLGSLLNDDEAEV